MYCHSTWNPKLSIARFQNECSLQPTTGYDWRHIGKLVVEKEGDEESDGSKALELGFLVEIFNASPNIVTLSLLFGLADDTFHERLVSKTLVIGFSLDLIFVWNEQNNVAIIGR